MWHVTNLLPLSPPPPPPPQQQQQQQWQWQWRMAMAVAPTKWHHCWRGTLGMPHRRPTTIHGRWRTHTHGQWLPINRQPHPRHRWQRPPQTTTSHRQRQWLPTTHPDDHERPPSYDNTHLWTTTPHPWVTTPHHEQPLGLFVFRYSRTCIAFGIFISDISDIQQLIYLCTCSGSSAFFQDTCPSTRAVFSGYSGHSQDMYYIWHIYFG